MAVADLEADAIVLYAGMNEGDLCKQVPGARWHGQTSTWRVPATWTSCQTIAGVFGPGLEVSPTLQQWAADLWTNKISQLNQLRLTEDLDLQGPSAKKLWPLQRPAAYAMVLAERYGEFDEMGGGKTRTTLAAMKMAVAMYGQDEVFPALVTCPNKVRRVWRNEAAEFWPDLRLLVMPKGKAQQRKALALVHAGAVDVLVTNWENLAGLSRLEPFGQIEMSEKEKTPGMLNEITWRTFVGDEAHRMKDRRAKQTRAAKAITFGTKSVGSEPSRFRWLLTGTPIANNSAEIWSLLNLLDPVAWPAYSRFVDRYATTTWNQFGGMDIGGVKAEMRDEFYACLDPMSIRRLRQQFDPFRPHRMFQTLTVPMELKQGKAYADMAKAMLAELDGGILVTTSAMVKAARLGQLAQAFGEMVDKGKRDPETGQTILDLQLKSPSNKVKAMMEMVEDLGITSAGLAGQTPIVFGASSRQLIGLCEEALIKAKIPYSLIAGGMSDLEQETNERRFEQGQTAIALCVIEAAKEGINSLVRAPILVFLQRSWSRVANEQFEARIDRPGQAAKSIQIIDIVSEGTTEEFDKIEKLAAKYQSFQEVVADERMLRLALEFKGEA